jgi:hypothetical protein
MVFAALLLFLTAAALLLCAGAGAARWTPYAAGFGVAALLLFTTAVVAL